MMDEKDHSIRFINSNYDTLFRIPDGSIVEVRFPIGPSLRNASTWMITTPW